MPTTKIRTSADGEVAVDEQAPVEERLAVGDGVDQEHPRGGDGDAHFEQDLGRVEPVELGAAVEHDLQRADGQGEEAEAEEIELAEAAHRVGHEQQDAGECSHADRHVDVEHPAPVEVVGEVGADDRADDRRDHDAHAPHRHRLAMALARVDVEDDRLRQRRQRGAEGALHDAEEHHLLEAEGGAAQRRGGDEAGDADGEQPLAADIVRQPAGDRRGDRLGDDIGGQHPGDGLLIGAEARLHVGQGDVGDRHVEDHHDHRDHHRDGDEAAMLDFLEWLAVCVGAAHGYSELIGSGRASYFAAVWVGVLSVSTDT